ncbi:hypothetical protein JCM10212_003052, partial [Sporobolomyces blumeae]
MADPHHVPLPPSRGSLDSNHGDLDGRPAGPLSAPPHLASLAESEDPTSRDASPPPDQPRQPTSAPDEPEQEEELRLEVENGARGADSDERIRALEDELDRTREDRDAWEAQYQSLLAKLTAMRQTVGDKLKQDA